MAKNQYNFEVLIRGKMYAYSPEEIVDRFNTNNPHDYSACYSFMDHCMGFSSDYSGQIKVTENNSKIRIGYFGVNDREKIINTVAVAIYRRVMKSQIADMEERVKVYDRSINALTSASVGWFGDTKQVSSTAHDLMREKEHLNGVIDALKRELSQTARYSDLPKNKDHYKECAKEMLENLDGIFILKEPTESDTIRIVDGKTKEEDHEETDN